MAQLFGLAAAVAVPAAPAAAVGGEVVGGADAGGGAAQEARASSMASVRRCDIPMADLCPPGGVRGRIIRAFAANGFQSGAGHAHPGR
jgi:hypothetical protein